MDTFSIDWSEFNFYAFPPFSLSSRCLRKIQQDKGKGIMIVPVWFTQTWFPLVLQLLYTQPCICQPSPTLLQHTSHYKLHPLHQKLHLMVYSLSGTLSDNKTCQGSNRSPHFFMEAEHQETIFNAPQQMVLIFVVRGQLITVHQR